MNKRIILLCFVFYTGIFSNLTAQDIDHLKNINIPVKRILPPLTPIADSLKTYQLISNLAVPVNYSSIDENKITRAFRLPSYTPQNADADMRLYVNVQKIKSRIPVKQTGQDAAQKATYQYTEKVTPVIEAILVTQSGDTLLKLNREISLTYATLPFTSEAEAKKMFDQRLKDPAYLHILAEAYSRSLEKLALNFKKNIEWEDALISLYYTKSKSPVLFDNLQTIKNGLQRINKSSSQEEIKNEIALQINQLEELAARPFSKKERHQHHACLLSLINIHRSLNNLDRASYYNQILIEENYIACTDLTIQLAQQKERTSRHQVFQKTGIDPIRQRQLSQTNWINAITQIGRCEGYIVLTNNETIKGELIDLLSSLRRMTVNIKYEKTLNDPIENHTYSLVDVKSIHTDQFDLAVVPYNDYLYICQIIAESPQLLLAETLPITNLAPIQSKERHYIQFIQKRNNTWKAAAFETDIEKGLLNVLNDCPQVAHRIQYDYYTIYQIPDAFNDYLNLCGDTSTQKIAAILTNKVPSLQINNNKGRTPSYTIGCSTGSNNFVSHLGINASFRIHQQLYARIGAGGGVWGPKFAAGLKYDMQEDLRYRSGWSYCLSYAYNKGTKSIFETSISNQNSAITTADSATASVRPLPIRTLSASTVFTKYLNHRVSYHLELGYSLPLTFKPWEIVEGDDSNKGIQRNIKLLKPGGLIVAIGVNVGF